MKRGKDDDKDDVAVASVTVNNNNNTKVNSNTSPNASLGTNGNDANTANAISSSSSAPGTVRTTGRVKKPKLVYDPSDNYISRGSRNSLPTPASSQVQPPAPALNSSANQLQSSLINLQTSLTNPPNVQAVLANSTEVSPVAAVNPGIKDESKEPTIVLTAEQQRNFDTCMKCGKSEPKRGSGYKSNFLTCKSCSMKWHFHCLPIKFETLTNARKKFKCEKCRRCAYCMTTKSADKVKELMMCCSCANVYHLECHWPPVARDKLGDPKWKCYSCAPSYNLYNTDEEMPKLTPQSPPRKAKAARKKRATSDPDTVIAKKMASSHLVLGKNGSIDHNSSATKDSAASSTSEDLGSSMPKQDDENSKGSCELALSSRCASPSLPEGESRCPSPALSLPSAPAPSLSTPTEDKEMGESANTTPPSTAADGSEQLAVQTWNVEQVVDYVEKFYPREADVFKSQEIDGAALLVLTRKDIIDRFGLKLGPALRIYELVLGLQTAVDDVTLAWCD